MSNSSFVLVLYAFRGTEKVGMSWLEILWPGIDGGELVMQNRAFYCLKKKNSSTAAAVLEQTWAMWKRRYYVGWSRRRGLRCWTSSRVCGLTGRCPGLSARKADGGSLELVNDAWCWGRVSIGCGCGVS